MKFFCLGVGHARQDLELGKVQYGQVTGYDAFVAGSNLENWQHLRSITLLTTIEESHPFS